MAESTSFTMAVAVDTGGTFTDVVLFTPAGATVVKVPSTPADPAAAVAAGVSRALADCGWHGPATVLIHGSTVATNALLEGRVARTALVTNRGFEDLLAIGRQARPQLYALAGTRPAPLVAAELRLGVAGRVAADGTELAPLDGAELVSLALRLRAAAAESVAVVLLHSYAYPAHEAAVAAGLRASGLPCSVSSELLPEYREYERMTTTVVNAAVAPIVSGYLGRLERCGLAQRVRIMGSSGGVLPVERARSAAAATILSGPAGGVAGALHAAARHGIADIVTFDMGGTSTDVSLCPGRALHTREFMVAGVPVALPVLDIHTVGAGGGSIARLDSGGALRVGPESAGAVPGPVCYGRGGTELTVTDANVALGRLIAVDDGALAIDASLIDAPLAQLARALDCTPAEAAAGIIAVIDTAMEGALRVISVERGHDPAGFTLVPFGGAAGLHAAALAERLEIPRILVPPAPGVLSAYGMLVAPPRRDVVRTVLLRDPADDVLAAIFAELELAARAALHEDGVDDVALHRTVAARYRGQSHELAVGAAAWREAFHTAHEQRFGYALRDAAVEAVTLRVEAVGPAPAVPVPHLARAHGAPPALGTRQMHAAGRVITAAVYRRETLLAGHVVRGPALVPERTASLWVPAAWQGEVLADGAVLLERAVT